MSKLKNILQVTGSLALFVLLAISFFNFLGVAQVQAAPPVCGEYQGLAGTCDNGLAKQLPDSQNPPKHNWTCSADAQTIDCSKSVVLCGNGSIDFGEECDGTNLDDHSCTDWNASGQLSCTSNCRFDSSKCVRSTCGDGKVEGLEQCEKGVTITKRCEDIDSNYHSGVLTCGNGCNFNTDTCSFCGNNKIDTFGGVTETCDGSDFGAKTCKDFGFPTPFTNGKLKCANNCSQIDTTGCNRSLCGNGIIDGTEECDGNNLGAPMKTCASSGCTAGGPLKCKDNCTLDKSTCTGCTASSCTNTSSSPWSNPFIVNVPCCGSRDGQWADNLTENSSGLCTGTVKNFRPAYANAAWIGWTWDCGDQANTCKAYKEPACPTTASVAATGCSTAKIYASRNAYEAALDQRFRQALDFKCGAGSYSATSQDSCGANNDVYTCRNARPGEATKSVRCVAGWAAASACGTFNNKNYKATASTGNCSADNAVVDFLSLTAQADSPDLCAPGSKAVNKAYHYGTAYDRAETQSAPYEGLASLNSAYKKWFSWQCQADDGRNGELTDCRATLDTSSCVAKREDAKCGTAELGRFAYEGDGPVTDFCAFGKLGGKPEYKVALDRNKPATWSWYCLASDGTGGDGQGKNKYCSVAATVYCGDADDGVYGTANEARAAGLCGGAHGVISEDIHSAGSQWTWTCADDKDASINVRCQASNRKCGYADSHTYKQGTFEAYKNNADFLCTGNSTPTVSLSTDFPASWTWKCGSNDCSATVLECGWGDGPVYHDDYYTDSQFALKRSIYQTFMCSNGNGAIKDLSQAADLGEGGYNPGWKWSCQGDSPMRGVAKDNLDDTLCTAHENKCGYFNGYSIKKDLFNTYKNQADKKDFFCTYGYEPESISDGGYYSLWYCVDKNDLSLKPNKILCQAQHPNCGVASDSGKAYYKQSLENHTANPFDGTLCNIYGTKVFPVTIGANNIWSCGGSAEFSTLSNTPASLNTQNCSAQVAGCGSANGGNVSDNNTWNDCKRGDTNNCLCSANSYARARYPQMVFDQQKYGGFGATWSCADADDNKGANVCQTKCSDCN